jgi:hypothetical protein
MALIHTGCLPMMRVPSAEQDTVDMESDLLFDKTTLDKRIHFLSNLVEQNNLSDEDRELAHLLLKTYQMLQEDDISTTLSHGERRLFNSLFRDLSLLDEAYFSEKARSRRDKEITTRLSVESKKVKEAYLAGDYQGVIMACQKMEKEFGPDALSPDIGLFFALALAESGMQEAAVKIGERILGQLEQRPGLVAFRAELIAWLMGQGLRDTAWLHYHKLVDGMEERKATFNRVAALVRSGDATRPDRETTTSTPTYHEGVQWGAGSLAQLLGEVDRLVQKQAFQDARLLLLQARLRLEEGSPDLEQIDLALRRVDTAEDRYLNEQASLQLRQAEALASARQLVEEEKYEEAIKAIDQLAPEQEMNRETSQLREKAVEKLINLERNRAAKLFLEARQTADRGKKKTLLQASYQKLKNLVEKYPSSALIERVKSNIKSVLAELEKQGLSPE